jgi:hypothetical protein
MDEKDYFNEIDGRKLLSEDNINKFKDRNEEKVVDNMKMFLSSYCNLDDYPTTELFLKKYFYHSRKNPNHELNMLKFKHVYDMFTNMKPVKNAIITGSSFGCIEMCRYFYEKYNTDNIPISKIFLYKNKTKYDYDIEVCYIDSEQKRKDGIVRQTSLCYVDESHYKDMSNIEYDGTTIVFDSDLFFYDFFSFNNFNTNKYFNNHSWLMKIDNNVKYWIGNTLFQKDRLNTYGDEFLKYTHILGGNNIDRWLGETKSFDCMADIEELSSVKHRYKNLIRLKTFIQNKLEDIEKSIIVDRSFKEKIIHLYNMKM